MAKSKVSKECIDAAAEALNQFTDSELRQYVVDVYDKARSYENMNPQSALKKAQQDVGNQILQELYNKKKTALDDASKLQRLIAKVEDKTMDIRKMVSIRYDGYADNVISFIQAAKQKLNAMAFGALEKKEYDYLRQRENGEIIAQALDGKSDSAIANKIARNMQDYIPERNAQTVNSGAMPLEYMNDDRMLKHMHDPVKLMSAGDSRFWNRYSAAAKPLWIKTIKSLLDLEKTFQHTEAKQLDGSIDESEVDNILNDIYDNITMNVSGIKTQSGIVIGEEDLARKRRMFFHFKDWTSLNKYNNQYGTGDFFSMWERDIRSASNKIGQAQMFGSFPEKAWKDLRDAQLESTPPTGDVRSRGATWYWNTENMYKYSMGVDQAPTSPTIANIVGNIKGVAFMAAQPLLALKSIPDTAFIADFGARWGYNYWRSFGHTIRNLFDIMPSEDRQKLAKLYATSIHAEMGMMARLSDNQNMSSAIKYLTMGFVKAFQIERLDASYKTSAITMISRSLGEHSKIAYSGLSDNLKNQLRKHGINELEWNTLRHKTERNLFTTDNVLNLSDSEIREMHAQSDQSVPLRDYRNRLFASVHSIFHIATRNAVPSGGEFEKAVTQFGLNPGTPIGAIASAIGQYKQFPIAYMDRIILNGYRDATGAKAKAIWATQLAVTTISLSVLVNNLLSVSQGKSWQDPSKMSKSELLKYGRDNLFGGLGIYLRILDPKNQNKSMLTNLIASPTTDLLGSAMSIPAAMATGNVNNAEKAFKDLANHVLPIKTLPFISPFLMGMLNEKPYVEPGQHIIYGY